MLGLDAEELMSLPVPEAGYEVVYEQEHTQWRSRHTQVAP